MNLKSKLNIESILYFSPLGDSFVNFIYSLALSKVIEKPVSKRVSNETLYQAFNTTPLKELKIRGKHKIADFVESFIFYAWHKKFISIHECVDVLEKNLIKEKLKESSIRAFTELINVIIERILKEGCINES